MNISQIFDRLYHEGPYSRQACEYGIVVLDEIDKLMESKVSSGGTNWGVVDQQTLLGMLDGIPVVSDDRKNSGPFGLEEPNVYTTKHILYIMTGAFSSLLNELRTKKAAEKLTSGFGMRAPSESEREKVEIGKTEFKDALLKTGATPEFIGRIAHYAEVKQLTREEYYEAIVVKENNILSHYHSILELSGKELVVSKGYIDWTIDKCIREGLGVRGCRNLISEDIRTRIFESYLHSQEKVVLCTEEERKAYFHESKPVQAIDETFIR